MGKQWSGPRVSHDGTTRRPGPEVVQLREEREERSLYITVPVEDNGRRWRRRDVPTTTFSGAPPFVPGRDDPSAALLSWSRGSRPSGTLGTHAGDPAGAILFRDAFRRGIILFLLIVFAAYGFVARPTDNGSHHPIPTGTDVGRPPLVLGPV